ncbi:MAG: trehalase family glycosidase, partial [Candidatus Thermoplasmatota archaeon]|nr:trehalase family glycosidase [Candidatus Thermoplasmatota archaeon]
MKRVIGLIVAVMMIAGFFQIPGFANARLADEVAIDYDSLQWHDCGNGVKFTGKPSYVSEFQRQDNAEGEDSGGPVSDFGSQCGIKADVDNRNFASIRHYACTTGMNIYDYSRTGLIGTSNLQFSASGKSYFAPSESREIRFHYFGWNEVSKDGQLSAEMETFFISLNTYALVARVTNSGNSEVKISPNFVLQMNPNAYVLSQSQDSNSNAILINTYILMAGGNGPVSTTSGWTAILPGFAITSYNGANPYTISGGEINIAKGSYADVFLVFSYSPDSQADALSLALSGMEQMKGDPWAAFNRTRDEWNNFFASIPDPHFDDPQLRDVYKMSATALRMDLYSPRNKMTYYGCTPTKVHYNWFWLWDTGFQSIGYAELDPWLGEQVILTTFQSQLPDGYIAHMTNDNLDSMTPHSQSPVFGFVADIVSDCDGNLTRAKWFVQQMYDSGASYISWWDRDRNRDFDGLYEFLSQDEGGWDNSPRKDAYSGDLGGVIIPYVGSLGEVSNSFYNPLDCTDVNAWMYFYFEAMAEWAGELGDAGGEKTWQAKADALGKAIDETLWNEDKGCWFDAMSSDLGATHSQVQVLTPAAWFPAFAGSSRDITKVRRVIEEHILNPAEFWGEYPIPTVSYGDYYFEPNVPGWRGNIWLVTTYSALETLFKYGYENEAEELLQRTIKMMSDQGDMYGIWENYNALIGNYKCPGSTGKYCAFQFGWSAAFAMESMLHRYERERFVFNDTME